MRNKRAEIERRMRLMAKAKVDMLLGLYVWPDGRPPVCPDGAPRVSNRELLTVGGYTPTYKNAEEKLFQDPFFLNQVRMEVSRRERRHGALAPFNPDRVTTIRDLAFQELETRLTNDPGAFTRNELIVIAEKFEVLSRTGNGGGEGKPVSDKMSQFNAFIGATFNVMNPEERERMVDTAADAAGDRISQLQKLIDEANTLEADADDTDVIDAEVIPQQD